MRRYLPFMAAIIIGLTVFGITFFKFEQKVRGETDLVSRFVPARDIGIHEVISLEDLKIKQFPCETEFEGAATDADDIVGKVAVNVLYKDWPISVNSVSSINDFEGKHIVTIKINYARTGGARPGDIVDVYLVGSDQSEWHLKSEVSLVASNAIVSSLTDQHGKAGVKNLEGIFGVPDISMGAPEKIEVVKLMVDSNEVPYMVPGAVSENRHYVLVVKYKESWGVVNNVWEAIEEESDSIEFDGEK